MDVTDDVIDAMSTVNSNSKLYQQFGNSIVIAVLCALFLQLNIHGIENWNDRIKQRISLYFVTIINICDIISYSKNLSKINNIEEISYD